MIDTNIKTSIIKQKIKIVVCFFFSHPKIKQDNIETTIKNSKINLREIKSKKH